MQEELRLTGETRALYVALMAVISAHHNPFQASKLALAAIEKELVNVLYQKGMPDPWVNGIQDLQNRLSEILESEYGN